MMGKITKKRTDTKINVGLRFCLFFSFVFMSQIYLKDLLKFQVIGQLFSKLFIPITNFLFFWPCSMGILVPQPGIKPVPSAVKAQSPNHWTAREFPIINY